MSPAVIISARAQILLPFDKIACDLTNSIILKKLKLKMIRNSSGIIKFKFSDISF